MSSFSDSDDLEGAIIIQADYPCPASAPFELDPDVPSTTLVRCEVGPFRSRVNYLPKEMEAWASIRTFTVCDVVFDSFEWNYAIIIIET